eukprot:1195962-Prorocentrum_minimum.AAC.7
MRASLRERRWGVWIMRRAPAARCDPLYTPCTPPVHPLQIGTRGGITVTRGGITGTRGGITGTRGEITGTRGA